jgi:hypothetical protein
LIHEVSAKAGGGFKSFTICDSISRPGESAIISTRHGEGAGVFTTTATLASSICGARRAESCRALRSSCIRYMPE